MRSGRQGKQGPRSDNRCFINALALMARAGGRWRDLPEHYGNDHTVKKRYYRWFDGRVLEALFEAPPEDADLDWISFGSTSIRA